MSDSLWIAQELGLLTNYNKINLLAY